MRENLDTLWKGLLEDTFEDFLRFMNPNVDAELDMQRGFEFLDTELTQTYLPENLKYNRPKNVDKLVKVFTHDGREEFVLVHVEVQGQYGKDFAKSMFGYYYRLFDKYDKPITAYAIFLEPNQLERPDSFEQNFMGTRLLYKYNTLKIANLSEQELVDSNNPFALAVLAAKSVHLFQGIKDSGKRDKSLLAYKKKLVELLISKEFSHMKIKALMNFLLYYINFDHKEISINFDNEIKLLINRNFEIMGIEEQLKEIFRESGKKEGLKEGLRKGLNTTKLAVTRNLIVKMGLSDEQIADLVEVSLSFVRKVRKAQQKSSLMLDK